MTALWTWEEVEQSKVFDRWWPGGRMTPFSTSFLRWCLIERHPDFLVVPGWAYRQLLKVRDG